MEHRLPASVRPWHYALKLIPDLDGRRFSGRVSIDIAVEEAIDEITIHAKELKIHATSLTCERQGGKDFSVLDVSRARLDSERDTITIPLPQRIAPGNATLDMYFTGKLSDAARGFYACAYTLPNGEERIMATTQFEPTDARRCFPCFDEPALKATFDVELTIPCDRMAISNAPVLAEREVPGDPSQKIVAFARTPRMSTYLLYLGVGEFEELTANAADGTLVRVRATPGKAWMGQFALDIAVRGIDFFNQYFGISYASMLPKVDLIAVPDFDAGAMENWGAITFREPLLLMDPAASSVRFQQRIAEVVLHEFSHFWFGDYATMAWWNGLWLNESFATYMAHKAMDVLFPEWRVFEDYVATTTSDGKRLDGLHTSHPVEVPVEKPSEIFEIFDVISYNKGGSILRMLDIFLGNDVFRDGIRAYLRKYAYRNANTSQLLRSVEKVAGLPIETLMEQWIFQTGHPVAHVSRNGGTVRLRQERFLLDGTSDPETLWTVPLRVRGKRSERSVLLEGREGKISWSARSPWLHLNADQAGFYRVRYSDEMLSELIEATKNGELPVLERYGLQEDGAALLRAGSLPLPKYLALTQAYTAEESHNIWWEIAKNLNTLLGIFHGDPAAQNLLWWARELFSGVTERVGWDAKPNEDHHTALLRDTVLRASARFDNAAVIAEARERFARACGDLRGLDSNLWTVVFQAAARYGDKETLTQFIHLYEKIDIPEAKVELLSALGGFCNRDTLRDAFGYALSKNVRSTDAFYAFRRLDIEEDVAIKPALWEIVREQWDILDQRYGTSHTLAGIIQGAAGNYPSEEHAKDVEAFFVAHPAPYAEKKVAQVLEEIRSRVVFREQNIEALAAFFSGKP